jgi:WD40 repeat protein
MDPRKQRIEAIFGAAVELTTPEQREIYLARACGDDQALRWEIEQLIQAYDKAGNFLTVSAEQREAASQREAAGATVALPATEKPGDRIGRYKLLQQIGEGGCGVVYVAEQEEPVRRRVALKVIKLGMDTKSVIARFEAERQALALMDHPNIARVFDAGATETGRPFFVMELVRGVRITDYCDESNLLTRERLDLFITVCHAIQHAHQKGIIHRDIKPSNILVTVNDGVPVPKVIDFGIAKATTQQRLTDKTLYTAFEQFIGTPAYMSPEQTAMTSLDIDTRSDIYALGVLLYELLTGKTPFDAQTLLAAGLDEMRRIIREQEPVRPSTRLSTMLEGELTTTAEHRHSEPPKLIHLLQGDLDWIVMKCLEKDRARRYETANELAQDIERHLKHEPVAARPPSAAYRVQKFVRRNKLMVAASSAVAAALVLGFVGSTWQAVRATQAKREQNRLREEAEKARDGESAQRRLAVEARKLAEQQQYSASIGQVQALIEQGQYGRAKQVLAQPSMASRRGWEWGWLERTCNLDLMTLSPGAGWLFGVAFSPDGRWLAAGGSDATVRLWDLATGSQRQPLCGHSDIVVRLGFSPDSRRLVTPSFDGTAKVWDVATGHLLFTLTNHSDGVYCAVFSPDGKTIATASRDKTVRLWDANTGAFLRIAGQYGDSVICVAFSPDGRRLAYAGGSGDVNSRSSDTTVRIVHLATGEMQTLTGHTDSVFCVAFHPDGNRVATASWDMTARLGDLRTDTELRPFFRGQGFGGLFSIAFTPDGCLCAVGGGAMGLQRAEAGVHVLDMETGREVAVFEGHARPIWGVAFSPDSTRIATTSFDGTVKLWPARPPPEFVSLEGHDQAVWTVAVSPNGQYVATGSLDQTAKIWHLETGRLLMTLPVDFPVVSLAFSPDSGRLVSVAGDATAKVWDLAQQGGTADRPPRTPEPALVLRGHSNTVTCVAYSPQGRWIATGSKDKTVRIWDAQSGRMVRVLEGHTHWVLSVAFSPEGSRLATASADHTARVWEAETGRFLFPLQGHSDWVLQVGWSPDGKRLATGGQDNTARLWDAGTGKALLAPLEGHRDGVSSLAFSPDSSRLATAGGGTEIYKESNLDNSVFLWDVATGQSVLRLRAHQNAICAVTFSRDGTCLVTGSTDNTARVRNAFAWRWSDNPGDSTSSPEERMEQYKRQYWSQLLADGPSPSPRVGRRVERRQLGEFNVAVERRTKNQPLRPIPARDPTAGTNQLDLSGVYNAALNETWHPTSSLDNLDQDLSVLPAGLRTLGSVQFDVRGVIQLGQSNPNWPQFPDRVRIPIGRRFRQLHVLHGTDCLEREDTVIGSYRLHYADGQAQELEIRYGRDVRDWWMGGDPKPPGRGSEVAWTAPRPGAPAADDGLRLYRSTYSNPHPDVEVIHIDFLSNIRQSAPFLVAMTVE